MGVGSGAIRAGRAFVELFADDTKLTRALTAAAGRLKSFGLSTAKVGAGVGGMGAAALAPITASFKEAVENGRDIGRIADRVKISTESVSGLAYAFESVGASLDEFGGTLDGIGAKIAAAADGGDETFRRLGLNARALINLPVDKQLELLADRFTQIKNPIDRANIAQEMFGSAGLKLLPILEKGAAGFSELRGEAEDTGAIVSGEQAKQAQQIWASYTAVLRSVKYALLEVGKALLPQASDIKEVAGQIRVVSRGLGQWIRDNKGLVLAVAGTAGVLVATGTALVSLGGAAIAASAGIGVLTTVVSALGVVIGAVFTPVGLGVAAGAALGAGLIYLTAQTKQGAAGFKMMGDEAERAWGEIKDGATEAATIAASAWEGISDAMSSGDFALAGEIGMQALTLGWAKFTLYATKKWGEFKGYFVDAFYDAAMLIRLGMLDLAASLDRTWIELSRSIAYNLVDGVKMAIENITEPAARALEAVGLDQKAAGLRGIGGGLGNALKMIDEDRKKHLGMVDDQLRKDRDAVIEENRTAEQKRAEARKAGLLAAQADVDGQQARLEALNAQAANGKALAAAWREIGTELGRAATGAVGKKADPFAGPTVSAKGAFSGPLGQQLAYGDNVAKRSLLELQKVADNTGRGGAISRAIGELTDQLRVK